MCDKFAVAVSGSYKAQYQFIKNQSRKSQLRRFTIAIELSDSGVPIF